MTEHSEATFGLVHGSWHGAWCWQYLQEELDYKGYKSVAMDLPVDNPSANFDDYADAAADALKGESDIILVGHSRAGNIIPRVAGKIAITKMVFLCSSFEKATIGRPMPDEEAFMPARNDKDFYDGVIALEHEMTVVTEKSAKELFYHDCSPEIQDWAAENLRPQRRSSNEPKLEKWPDVPQEYILCEDDRVVRPVWSRYAAMNWLGVEPISLPGGHSPFLSRPRQLAEVLDAMAKNEIVPSDHPATTTE